MSGSNDTRTTTWDARMSDIGIEDDPEKLDIQKKQAEIIKIMAETKKIDQDIQNQNCNRRMEAHKIFLLAMGAIGALISYLASNKTNISDIPQENVYFILGMFLSIAVIVYILTAYVSEGREDKAITIKPIRWIAIAAYYTFRFFIVLIRFIFLLSIVVFVLYLLIKDHSQIHSFLVHGTTKACTQTASNGAAQTPADRNAPIPPPCGPTQ